MSQRPQRDPEHPDVVLGVAAVARRLGVATSTLRTWDRRYGLGPSEHRPGRPRQYTQADLARLQRMRELMLQGVSAAEAARAALAAGALEARPAAPPASDRPARPHPARPGGGRVLALRDASPAARGLARAAVSLDADSCTELLLAAVRRRGVAATWQELLAPVLAGLDERWQAHRAGAEVEHLLSECAETALRVGVRPARVHPPRRPVLVAALEPESGRLPVVATAAALAERRLPVRQLGASLPEQALAAAVTRLGPAAVVLWARAGTPDGAPLPDPAVLSAVRPRPWLVLAGPGYQAHRFRPQARWAPDLPELLDLLAPLVPAEPAPSAPPAR